MSDTAIIPSNPIGSPETSVASSVIPYQRDDHRALFLGYRACGLSIREALHLIDRSAAWLSGQRHDPEFVELESRIPEFRETLRREYAEIDFYRNFRLVMEKDHRILLRALGMRIGADGKMEKDDEPLNKAEHEYLLKMRTQYSPTQLQILEAITKDGGGGFNFAKFIASNPDIVQLSRTDTLTMAKRGNGDQEG